MLFVCHPKILHKHYLQFLSGVKMASRETENSTYANCRVTNLTKSIMVCFGIFWSGQFKRPRIKLNNSKVHVARSSIPGLVSVAWLNLRSRRLEVLGTRKNRRARRRPRVSLARPFSGSFAHYFQAPATQAKPGYAYWAEAGFIGSLCSKYKPSKRG